MMMKLALAAFVITAGFACKHGNYRRDEAATRTTYERDTASTDHSARVADEDRDDDRDDDYKDRDNTAMNKRDSDGRTITPMDQRKGSDSDLALTAKIREVVTDDDSLSTKAQNVKIITLKGITTLRGPVETMAEKTKVEQLARRAGARNINNQLEVTTKTE